MASISGYRELTPEDIELINHVKAVEAQLNALIDRLRENTETDKRLVSTGATEAEKAFMLLTKSIARPERLLP